MLERPVTGAVDWSEDGWLGGAMRLRQFRAGHRVGTDALLLIEAAGAAARVVDLGAGVGAVGLGLLARGAAEQVWLVERDAATAALAADNIVLNGFGARAVLVAADVTAPARVLAAAGLPVGQADLVVANPPFNSPRAHRASPNPVRAQAHAMEPDALGGWIKAAARALRPGGRFVVLHRPDALPWLMPALAARFGSLTLTAVQPRADAMAHRVLIEARLNSKAPTRIAPALVLHPERVG
jgi:tRNA1(Val) A37 N6-methylase TrmN6